MSDNYPANSHKSQADEKAETKKEEPVIERLEVTVVRQAKPGLLRRVRQSLFSGDPNSVFGYLVRDVLIPAAQNLVTDFVQQGVEKAVYGDVRNRRTTYPRGGVYQPQQNHYNYSQASQQQAAPRQTQAIHPMQSPQQQRPAGTRGMLQVPNQVLATRDDATLVLDYLHDIMRKYGIVTVANVNSALNQSGTYTDQYWGWTDLNAATYQRVRDGYELILPPAEDLRQ